MITYKTAADEHHLADGASRIEPDHWPSNMSSLGRRTGSKPHPGHLDLGVTQLDSF